ncbi:cytochrome P450 [Corynespora cassiicola Philippines]|uniref:Cytochrome P450 n=1 Tax=Corynespora cassiicola Philippines TaxID=1448308 RepID=A0A2T2N2Q1_CORCC|nr:cytochrome P450 [Corynespora cassiicola Philippines]
MTFRTQALASVGILLPFLLIIWNRRGNKLNLPSAGSGFRIPSFLLPICSLFWGRDLIEDIYNKHKHDPRPYLLPGLLGDEVVLPTSWIPWLASKPESILSGKWSRIQRMNFDTTFMHAEIVTNPIQETVIRHDIIANLDKLAPEMAEEISVVVDELWGCDTENYKTVSLEHTIFRIVARASGRIFAGKEVCRNADFIDNSIRFTMVVITSGFLKTLIPKFLESFLVWIIVSYVRFHYSKLARVLEPLFQSTEMQKQPRADVSESNSKERNPEGRTAAQWLAANATRDPNTDPKEQTPPWLALRLMSLLFAAVDTSSLTSVNVLLDLFTERVGGSCVPALREEASRNKRLFGEKWNRARLNDMPCHDSALRESMRLSGFAIKILQRKVMSPEGIALPDGTVLPRGTMVCVSAWGLHHDEKVYSNPLEFSPKRFIAGGAHSSETEPKLRKFSDRKGMLHRTAAEADASFIFWGLGKQSCPGRYMAVDLIKILMEYVVMNYDVVPLKERPLNMWVEYNYVPSAKAKLQVRRRK